LVEEHIHIVSKTQFM